MSNYGIRIDLQKVQGAFIKDIAGRNATKKCICIPIEECDYIYPGAKGTYLNLTALEMREAHYGDTHMLKPSISKEAREMMSEEERNSMPILGSLKPFGGRRDAISPASDPQSAYAGSASAADDPDGDLPF